MMLQILHQKQPGFMLPTILIWIQFPVTAAYVFNIRSHAIIRNYQITLSSQSSTPVSHPFLNHLNSRASHLTNIFLNLFNI